MIRKLKDKFFIFELITGLLMLIVCVQLVKLQLADHNKYLEQSRSKLYASEIISAPRGKILDRYGRPIVTNRLGFSVSFVDSSLSDDELNTLILNTINLFNKNGDEYIDTFPIVYDGENYIFSYDGLEGNELETKVRNTKFALKISDNLDAQGRIKSLK